MLLLPVVLSILKAPSAAFVVTSSELLHRRGLPEKVRTIAEKHRWILFGEWKDEDRANLADQAEKLARWRASDLATESVNAGSESQKVMLSNWKKSLEPSHSPGLGNDIRRIVQGLPARAFPLQDSPCGHWTLLNATTVQDLDRRSGGAATDLLARLSSQFSDPDVKAYMLLRRTAGTMYVYLSTIGYDGKALKFDSIAVDTATSKDGGDRIAAQVFASPTAIENPIVSNGKRAEGIRPANLDLTEIQRVGFLSWLHERIADPAQKKPVALLANDADLIVYLRDGGSFESFLMNRGYREVQVGRIKLLVPEFFDEAERVRLREDLVAELRPEDDWALTMKKNARWAQESHLGSSLNLINYVEAAVAWQRHLPMMSEQVYPFLPILKDLSLRSNAQTTQTFPLLGSNGGREGDTLMHDRIGDSFAFGEKSTSEQSLGLFWGAGGWNQLRSVSFSVQTDRRLRIPKMGVTDFDVSRLVDNIYAFGQTWESIELKMNAEPFELVQGETVTVTFQTTRGRLLVGDYFFPRSSLGKKTLKDLPDEMRNEIRDRAVEMIEADKSLRRQTPPPPPRAVQ